MKSVLHTPRNGVSRWGRWSIKRLSMGATLLTLVAVASVLLIQAAKAAYNIDFGNNRFYFSGHQLTAWTAPGIGAINPIYFDAGAGEEFPDGTHEPGGAYQSSGNVMPNKAGQFAVPHDSSNAGGQGGAVGFQALGLTDPGSGMINDPDRKQKLFNFLVSKNQSGTDWEKMGSAFVISKMIQRSEASPWGSPTQTMTPTQVQELEDRLVNNPDITMTYDSAYYIDGVQNTTGVQYLDIATSTWHYDVVDGLLTRGSPADSEYQAAWVFRDTSLPGNPIVFSLEINCANPMGGFSGLPDFDPPVPQIDLELTKLVDGNADWAFAKSEMIQPGVPFRYQVTVQNTSAVTATGVAVRDPLPAGVTLLGTTPSQGTTTPTTGLAPTLTWNIGTITPSATHTLILDVVVYEANLPAYRAAMAAGVSRNVAEISAANELDIDSTPNNVDTPYVPANREDDEDHADTFMLAGLGDYVWFDTNSNGQQDTGEPGINGVTVRLLNGSGTVLATTTTHTNAGQDGYYEFRNLTPGVQYIVRFVTPAGHAPTMATASGVTVALNSDANVVTGRSAPVVLAPGEFNPTIDAGYIPLLSLGDTVWHDTNDNGVIDTGETGVPNVPVLLYEDSNSNGTVDPSSDTLITSTTTDGDGKYLFTGLAQGSYFVVIPSSVLENGGVLERCRPSSVAIGDPNTDIDHDNNGALRGSFITSATPITLSYDDEPQQSGAANLTYDFGFHCPAPAVPNTGFAVRGPVATILLGIGGILLTGSVALYARRRFLA